MPHDALAAALLALCQGGEGIPLNVRISPSDDILALRARISELEGEIKRYKEILERSEYKRGCERQIRENLMELCRSNGIKVPREVFKNIW